MRLFLASVYVFFTVSFSTVVAQNNIVQTKVAQINFDAAKSAIEPITAENKSVKIIFDTKTGKIACLVMMPKFSFPNKLMQEHFNENYIESDKFPKGIFLGEVVNYNTTTFTDTQVFQVEGEFEIHGVKKKKTFTATFTKQDGGLTITSEFVLFLKDFKIKIPSIMFYKIAEEVNVSLFAKLK